MKTMHSEHTTDGFGANEITVNEKGEIRIPTTSESINIGNIHSLYELDLYEDGTYTNDNGVVVDLERLIDGLEVTDTMVENLKRNSAKRTDSDARLTNRMLVLHYLVYTLADCADSHEIDWVVSS